MLHVATPGTQGHTLSISSLLATHSRTYCKGPSSSPHHLNPLSLPVNTRSGIDFLGRPGAFALQIASRCASHDSLETPPHSESF
jgi:hypothetical protein